MAKRRESSGDEVSLFPFLSILACLIGALVMIIVVLVVSQTKKAAGRDPEEVQRAIDAKRIQKELEERKQDTTKVQEILAILEKREKEIEEKRQRFIKLRKLLDSSKDVQDRNKEISLQLQKELDDLMLEIDGLKKQQVETKKEIETLMAEIKKRQIPPDKKPPPVVVQPSGSGMAEGTKVYFVEASGGGLKIINAWGEDYRLSAQAEVVVADAAYTHFLTELAKDPKSLILFLIRDDGAGAFNNGAGRAESDFNIRVGKLPIPGRGDLKLDMFDAYRGKIPPPPPPSEVPAGTPPATPPPGAPPATTPPGTPKAGADAEK